MEDHHVERIESIFLKILSLRIFLGITIEISMNGQFFWVRHTSRSISDCRPKKKRKKMGRVYLEHFGGSKLFSCAQCDTFLTNRAELISTRFTGATGRAFLFNRVVNLNYRYFYNNSLFTIFDFETLIISYKGHSFLLTIFKIWGFSLLSLKIVP